MPPPSKSLVDDMLLSMMKVCTPYRVGGRAERAKRGLLRCRRSRFDAGPGRPDTARARAKIPRVGTRGGDGATLGSSERRGLVECPL